MAQSPARQHVPAVLQILTQNPEFPSTVRNEISLSRAVARMHQLLIATTIAPHSHLCFKRFDPKNRSRLYSLGLCKSQSPCGIPLLLSRFATSRLEAWLILQLVSERDFRQCTATMMVQENKLRAWANQRASWQTSRLHVCWISRFMVGSGRIWWLEALL